MKSFACSLRSAAAAVGIIAALAGAQPALGQQAAPDLVGTYIRLANNTNAVLWETAELTDKSRIVVINTHADHANNFEYFVGRELATRGYRALNVNYYGDETEFEEFIAPIAAAVRYARGLPGVEAVLFATHSGGGPMLAYYQELAENGPAACQEPNRIYPCDPRGLENLPPVDGVMFLSANIGAPHRLVSLDPAVANGAPRERDPALDLYNPENGYDPATNTARYTPEFLARYLPAVHARSEGLVAEALALLAAIEEGAGPYKDDAPFVIDGMASNSLGARLNLGDDNLMIRTHGEHLILRADDTRSMGIVQSVRPPVATPEAARETLEETTQNKTLRHYLSFLALRTTPDYAVTADNVTGIDWRSSANSLPGNLENVTVPTLIMAGTCAIHLVFNEIAYDRSAAADKTFVAVEGANHQFNPCQNDYGATRVRAFDYVESWLAERF